MIILLGRGFALIFSVITGIVTSAILLFPIYMLLEASFRKWELPFESLYRSQPPEIWIFVIYAFGVVALAAFPALQEYYLDFIFGHRKLSQRERKTVAVIEEELAWRCRSRNLNMPKLNWRVEVNNSINASAYGRNRICLTQRSMITAREGTKKWREGITALCAHELGHLYHGDGITGLWIMLLQWPAGLLKRTLWILSHIKISVLVLRRLMVSIGFVFQLLYWFVWLLYELGWLPNRFVSRRKEYRADRFTVKLGLGREMTFVMEHWLRNENCQAKGFERFVASHPSTEFRIEQIEKQLQTRGMLTA